MNDMTERDARAHELMKAEYLPLLKEEQVKSIPHQTFPLSTINSLGIAFEPITQAIQYAMGNGGGSGLYYVNTKGMEMFSFNDGRGFLGSLKAADGTVGGGQAIINQIPFNPAMLCLAIAMMKMEKKLGEIEKIGNEILNFLQAEERAKVRGSINTLNDIMNEYRFNSANEKFKTNKHILVQDIRKDAEQSVLLYREQIQKAKPKKKLLQSDKNVTDTIQKLHDAFQDYQMAVYLYAYSTYLKVMLLENFGSAYIESTIHRIQEYVYQYRELYTDCYNLIEESTENTIQSMTLKGLSAAAKGVGTLIQKTPVISRGQVDENLIDTGEKLKKFGENRNAGTLKEMIANAETYTQSFVENLHTVDHIYNDPLDLLFDGDNLYLLEE